MKHKRKRLLRLWFPKQRNHSAWLLMNAVGRPWLMLTGWKREYPLYGMYLDLANPYLKLVIEADGSAYHMDVVREMERDELLQELGWKIRHYRYPALKKQPLRVKQEIRSWYKQALIDSLKL